MKKDKLPGLSRERIVVAAIDMMDDAGEGAVTFRALAARFATGNGAIQWHVPNKNALIEAAAAKVLTSALSVDVNDALLPHDAIDRIAESVFHAVDEHFWVATRLAKSPWPRSTMLLFEHVGRRVQALTPRPRDQFSATSALVHYIIGASGQNASNARSDVSRTNRRAVLDRATQEWSNLDVAAFPFTRSIAGQLNDHDDVSEFLAGIALIVAGIAHL